MTFAFRSCSLTTANSYYCRQKVYIIPVAVTVLHKLRHKMYELMHIQIQ